MFVSVTLIDFITVANSTINDMNATALNMYIFRLNGSVKKKEKRSYRERTNEEDREGERERDT